MGGTAGTYCVGQRLVLPLAFGLAVFFLAASGLGAVTSSTIHGAAHDSLNGLISTTDLIHGRQTVDIDVFENPTDSFGISPLPGWHPVNTDPADQLAAFTDGLGIRSTGFSGLLNDNFPVANASGKPAKIVEYPFDTPVDIGRINIFSGNRVNSDGRIFSTTYIEYSRDNGFTYQPLGFFQSDPFGTINRETNPVPPLAPAQGSTLVSVFDNANATMLSGVTNLIFNLYSVDNTGGQYRDPFDGLNPITGLDDGLSVAFNSPIIFELDVLPPSAGQVGDYNGNGKVDAADYTKWRDTLNANVANGTGADGSGNGVIDEADYSIWKMNFGNGGPGAAAVVVPEPAAMTLLSVLFVSIAYVVGSRRRSWPRC